MFPFEPNEYLDQYPNIFVSNFQNFTSSSSSSSSPLSSNGFFNSGEFRRVEIHQTQYRQPEVINHVPEAESLDLEKRDDQDQGLKFTLWKNEDDQSEIKWMSSKIMRKMKGSDHGHIIKFKDQKKKQASSSLINHDHPPIRVCADCNTTKTPLWRSGPNGPKSLCNACGIRQRKARRAMAAAAESGKRVAPAPVLLPETTSPMIKVKNKEFKKRCRSPTEIVVAESSSNKNAPQKKKNSLEDFFFNFSKNLSLQRVFPQEETDAAILLMALSCS